MDQPAVGARPWIIRCLATAVLYGAICELALLAAYSSIALCAFWPAAAVAMVCIWRWRWAGVAGVFAGSLALSAIGPDFHAGAAIGIALGRTGAGLAGAWFLRWAGFDPAFARVRDALLLLVASGSSAIAGLAGAFTIVALDPDGPWLLIARTWTLGDALGILACAPALFTLGPMRDLRSRIPEAALLVAVTVACAVLVYLVLEPELGVTGPALFLVFPPLLWAALRFGARGAAWAMLLVGMVAFAGAATGSGVFIPGAARDGRLASFQAFLAALSVTFLVVGAAMDELRASHLRALGAGRMEAVGRMAGGIAHDFNNLLAVIIGCAEVIRRRQPPGGDPRPLDRLMSAAQRGAGLTGQLLAFSRGQPLSMSEVDLAGLVRCSEELIQGIVASRPAAHGQHPPDIQVCTDVDGGPAPIRGEPILLGQVLMNLVANARDAMAQGGTLTIEVARHADGSVRLAVGDTGPGMDEATRMRVFEPYFTTKAHGHGLGLATVHGIVAQHGGRIEIDSRPGAGARFTVTFPAPPAMAPAEPPPEVPHRAGSHPAGQRILIVDDHPEILATLQAMLEDGRRVIRTAGDAASGKAAIAAGGIDVLITDWQLPDGTGADLLAAAGGSMAVVVVTGFAERDLALPADVVVVPKPCTRDGLEAGLARAVAARALRAVR
ncbi:MAG: hypothetical protein RLZZ127_710 [Planctomycetota bacterium]|jgi:signal transduction histidine kinase